MIANARLAQVFLKVERAIKHFDDLQVIAKSFIDSSPYKIAREIEPDTGYYIFKVQEIQSPPVEITLIAGDVIHCARAALDHLAYQLVLANGGKPTRHTSFPIFDSPAKYKTMDVRKVKGMSRDAIDAIGAAKPYFGGNNGLWLIHDLDIIDKHRTLLTAMVSVPQIQINIYRSTAHGLKAPAFAMPNLGCPLKNGDPFFKCEPGVEDQTYPTFEIAFGEPEIIQGKALVPTLFQLLERVDGTITAFESLLA